MKFRIKSEADVDALKAYLERIPVARAEYDVEIRKHKEELSDKQRNLYWKWIGIIASETGNDRDMLHKVFKAKFLGWDEVVVLGKPVKKERSITTLGTKEMWEYMTQVDVFALQELDIVLPHPEDLYYGLITDQEEDENTPNT